MDVYFITVRSVTFAQRAEHVLRKGGIGCTLQRTPRWMEEQGCGYSIRVHCQDVMPALELLRAHDISFRKVYLRRENGKMEELAL